MVKQELILDSIFGSLADPTRRDILRRVAKQELSVSEIAKPYNMSMPAISKHLRVLENATLIIKHTHGKQHIISILPTAIKDASDYLQSYKKFWEDRLDSLESYLKLEEANDKKQRKHKKP